MIKKIGNIFIAAVFLFAGANVFATTFPLPSNLIAMPSPVGDQLFTRSYVPRYFWPLALQFVTQENHTYCSIASSVMVLNALNISPPIDPVYAPFRIFTQDNFFTPAVKKVLSPDLVKKEGSTLDQISHALMTYPVSVKTIYANEVTVNQFRAISKKTIDTDNGYIIINFLRTGVGEKGFGHMSPLAAYDARTDRFLMLDVARYRYPSAWIKTQSLFNAMHTIDDGSRLYRGFIIVSNKNKPCV